MPTVEYYTLGSADEAIGLTPMTRLMGDDGKPICQYGKGPEGWYKPNLVTEETFNEIFKNVPPEKRGSFGVVNAKGRAKFLAKEAEKAAIRKAKEDKIVAHEAKKIERMVAKGIIDEADVDQELASKGFSEDAKSRIKEKRDKDKKNP